MPELSRFWNTLNCTFWQRTQHVRDVTVDGDDNGNIHLCCVSQGIHLPIFAALNADRWRLSLDDLLLDGKRLDSLARASQRQTIDLR
jgi:hypothetical protein